MSEVFQIPDLLGYISQFCNTSSFVTLFNVSKSFRLCVEDYLKISSKKKNIVRAIVHSGCILMLKYVISIKYPLDYKTQNIAARY